MQIKYYTAPCGAGKSYQAAVRMVNTPGRYLVVRDRVEAITEYMTLLYAMANAADVQPSIRAITAERGESVRLNVEALPSTIGNLDHAIVLITHKALMMCDFSGFCGWSIIIDETPVVIDRQDLQTAQSAAWFATHYDLQSVHKGWSSVTLSADGWGITPADLERDDLLRSLRIFHERVTNATPVPTMANRQVQRRAHDVVHRAVIGSLDAWEDMADGRRWTWWSLWSPRQLEAFDSIEIMANAFEKSITFELLRAVNPDIDWVEVPMAAGRHFARRKVVIRYYAEQHVASLTLFDSDMGKSHLKAIAQHQARDRQIWMANDRHVDHLDGMGGLKLRPHQAGSNQYADINAATCIYAAKPSTETRAVMSLLGVDASVWTRSYEHEAILQFCCRTSVRDPSSTATVVLTVYDREQANYLAAYFRDQPHCDVEMELVDLGFAQLERTTSGVKAKVLSAEEAEAKREARKAQKTLAQRLRRAAQRKKGQA